MQNAEISQWASLEYPFDIPVMPRPLVWSKLTASVIATDDARATIEMLRDGGRPNLLSRRRVLRVVHSLVRVLNVSSLRCATTWVQRSFKLSLGRLRCFCRFLDCLISRFGQLLRGFS